VRYGLEVIEFTRITYMIYESRCDGQERVVKHGYIVSRWRKRLRIYL